MATLTPIGAIIQVQSREPETPRGHLCSRTGAIHHNNHHHRRRWQNSIPSSNGTTTSQSSHAYGPPPPSSPPSSSNARSLRPSSFSSALGRFGGNDRCPSSPHHPPPPPFQLTHPVLAHPNNLPLLRPAQSRLHVPPLLHVTVLSAP